MLEVLNLKEQLQKSIPSSSFYWFFCFQRFFSSLFYPTKK
jgi:hypothetical protein